MMCPSTTLRCASVCVFCGFTLQGHRVSGSYWQPQWEDDMEKGDGAGLMADSSCLWSALHSVHIKNLLPDESGVELERRVESEVERRRVFFFLFFLMETSIWQGHGPSSFISICGLSLISCPPVYLPHLSAGRCLRYTNFMTDPSPIKKEWVCNFLSHINTHIPVCLSCPSVRDSVMLFGCLSLWWPARSKMPTDPACQRETLHSCSLPRWQTSPTLRF